MDVVYLYFKNYEISKTGFLKNALQSVRELFVSLCIQKEEKICRIGRLDYVFIETGAVSNWSPL